MTPNSPAAPQALTAYMVRRPSDGHVFGIYTDKVDAESTAQWDVTTVIVELAEVRPAAIVAVDLDAVTLESALAAIGHVNRSNEPGRSSEARDMLKAAAPASAAQATSDSFTDECVASGQSCSYGQHGIKGERQCQYCGGAPAVVPKARDEAQDVRTSASPAEPALRDGATDCNFLLSTMDAKVWADEFCKHNKALDHGTMLGWFANAIMTGHDEAQRRALKSPATGAQEQVGAGNAAKVPHVMQQAIQMDGELDESFYRRVVYNNGWNACRDFMLTAAPEVAPVAPNGLDLTDEGIVKVLASFGIDADKSKYGFPELQVSTNIPGIRKVIAAYLGAPVAPAAPSDEPTERESLIACLGDDAAKLRQENPDDEMAQTMLDAAAMLEADVAPAAQGAVWQPIETAPKDGHTLLLGCANTFGNWRTMRGQWFSQAVIDDEWEDPDGFEAGWYETAVEPDAPNCWEIAPTHWQPLPAAPSLLAAEPTAQEKK